jgi:phytoene dehydrogenase-like protein
MGKTTISYDAVIVGAGPNGLAAAITIARSGYSVLLIEGKNNIGGGVRSSEHTLPGFIHDSCSAIHPLAVASPFFRSLPKDKFKVEYVHSPSPLAHPLDDGTAIMLERTVEETAYFLEKDRRAYYKLMAPLAKNFKAILDDILGPLPLPPRHFLSTARFGVNAMRSARSLAEGKFSGDKAKALFAGISAHSFLPLEKLTSAAFGLVLGMLGHSVGWPLIRGGSQKLSDSLVKILIGYGGKVFTDWMVQSIEELPKARVYLFNITPKQLLDLAGHRLPSAYRKKLARYRYGPGVFKIDWALSEPPPWKAADCKRAATLHLGGMLNEISLAEKSISDGKIPEKPFVLFAQQSLFDSSRAPENMHTAWAYCHVPNGSSIDMIEKIEAQVERFAPGFKDVILQRSSKGAVEMEVYNPNYVGGDINGGVQDIRQLFTRPTARLIPYSTPAKDIYICSSSTPPGGGVHGMCGYLAAKAAIKHRLKT